MDFQTLFQSAWLWLVSFSEQLIPVYILPNVQLIIQVIILVAVGWIAGKAIKWGVVKAMGGVGLKRITSRTWAESLLKATGYRGTILELIGDLVKWLIYILFLALIIQVAGFPGIAEMFTGIAIFMPRFIGAIILIVIGFIIADFFGKVFEEAGRRFLGEDIISRVLAGLIKYSIALIALIMSLALIGLDTASLTVMFTAILAALLIMLVIGIKDLFPNFSAGLHLKKSLKPGEKIRVAGHQGLVERIEPFSVTLKAKGGSVTIPNSLLIKNPIVRLAK